MKLDYQPAEGAIVPNRSSRRGLASFVIALVVLLVWPCVIFWAAMHWGRTGPSDGLKAIFGVWLILGLLLSVAGLCLGISCAIDRRRRNALALAGLVLNGIIVATALCGLGTAIVG